MAQNILVVEDDRTISDLVEKNLHSAGFDCHKVHDGAFALQQIRQHQPDLVILDIMLPSMDGLEITRRLREESNLPILLLTALGSESDKILGLELGADDYLTKPFSPKELIARVRALLRRSSSGVKPEILHRGRMEIDAGRRRLEIEGKEIELTSLEFDLLYFMAGRPAHVFSRDALMQQVWGEDRVVDGRSIDSLISRLRHKIEKNPSRPEHIQTVWGAGYRFVEESS